MAENPADELVPIPARGRTFTASRLARFGDMSPGGRLRLDAVARYMQDVSGDDSADSGLGGDAPWVVRRLAIEIHADAGFREPLDLTTWCSGWGPRWAERRVSITGEAGARIEGAVLWVYVDLETGVPKKLPEEFFEMYDEAAGGRRVRAKLAHDPTVPDGDRARWHLRFVDFDPFDHVNNAVYFAVVEEELARRRDLRAPIRAEVEYRAALEEGHHVEIASRDDVDGSVSLWLVDGDSDDPSEPQVLATTRIWRL